MDRHLKASMVRSATWFECVEHTHTHTRTEHHVESDFDSKMNRAIGSPLRSLRTLPCGAAAKYSFGHIPVSGRLAREFSLYCSALKISRGVSASIFSKQSLVTIRVAVHLSDMCCGAVP